MKQNIKQYKHNFFKNNHLVFGIAVFAAVMTASLNLGVSWLMQQILDLLSGHTTFSLKQIIIISLVMLIALIIFMLLDYLTRPAFIHRAMRQYKDYAFEKITQKSINSFTNENSSTYLSILTNDVTSIENNYLANLFLIITKSIMFIGAFAMMLCYSPLLTLAAFLLSIVPIVGSLLTGNHLAVAEKKVSDCNDSFLGMVKDALSGFSVIKSFKAEVQIIQTFADKNRETEYVKCKRRKIGIIIELIGAVTAMISQFGVFLFGTYLAISGRAITPGIVIVFVQLMNFILEPISSIPQYLANRKAAVALIEKLDNIVNNNVRGQGISINSKLQEAIKIHNLSFSYDESAEVLHDINLSLEHGKSYAIVGGSGSGKSTLLNLLMGGYENYKGEIRFDENELRSIDANSLYDLVSIVQQKVFIFNSTIYNNIAMFHDFDEEKVLRAIKMAGLSELIAKKGMDYLCGENGSGLSGGEQQRISIARALLHETSVLLVDEATAALDAKTAFEVANSILEIPEITRIVVTHKLDEALLCKYDQILVLHKGTIEETGSFEQLMNKKEYFYSLFTVSQ